LIADRRIVFDALYQVSDGLREFN